MLQLIVMNRCLMNMNDETDVTLRATCRRLDEIIKEVCLRMIMEGGRVNDPVNVFSSMMM